MGQQRGQQTGQAIVIGYSSNHVARDVGVSVRTLRRWEAAGLTPPPQRSPGNRRIYSTELVQIVRQVASTRKDFIVVKVPS